MFTEEDLKFDDNYKEFEKYLSHDDLRSFNNQMLLLKVSRDDLYRKYNQIVSDNITQSEKDKFLLNLQKTVLDKEPIDLEKILSLAHSYGFVNQDFFSVLKGEEPMCVYLARTYRQWDEVFNKMVD